MVLDRMLKGRIAPQGRATALRFPFRDSSELAFAILRECGTHSTNDRHEPFAFGQVQDRSDAEKRRARGIPMEGNSP